LLEGKDLHARGLVAAGLLRDGQGTLKRGLALDACEPSEHQRVPRILSLERNEALVVRTRQRAKRHGRAPQPADGGGAAVARGEACVQRGRKLTKARGVPQPAGAAGCRVREAPIGFEGVAVTSEPIQEPAHGPRFGR
jgi:hypothetical protein